MKYQYLIGVEGRLEKKMIVYGRLLSKKTRKHGAGRRRRRARARANHRWKVLLRSKRRRQ
jgi:hypothetical protein